TVPQLPAEPPGEDSGVVNAPVTTELAGIAFTALLVLFFKDVFEVSLLSFLQDVANTANRANIPVIFRKFVFMFLDF
ncbi:hypothetical protein O6382_24865, partial [Salmonella enterica subsp. enterica]